MRIGWYDHGLFHQSSAIPDLPDPSEVMFVYGPKAGFHSRVNVVGMEMWRTPLLHRLLDDGHEMVWLTRRKVDPMPELDEDLARLVQQRPEFAPHVRKHDPCLDKERFLIWPIRTHLNQHYFDDQRLFAETEAPTSYMLRYWVKEQVLGVPPEVDVFVCGVMRADEATAFEVSYLTAIYLERGTPVVLWDQDHQLGGTVAAFKRLDHPWPNPLVTVIGPYEEEVRGVEPLTIDYPYVTQFEKEPLSTGEKNGAVYVGNDYGRREAMERLLLHLPQSGVPVTVYGRYDAKDGPAFMEKHPEVTWAGRIPSNQVPGVVAKGHFTMNMVKKDYMPIGLLTLRTFDANCYGTLQIGDRRVRRLSQYIPDDYLVATKAESIAVAKRIMRFDDDDYTSELEVQRELTRRNDMDAFTARFYECLDVAMHKVPANGLRKNLSPGFLSEVDPPRQHQPGKLCTADDERLPAGLYWHEDGAGWTPDWKEKKEAQKA